MRRGSIVGPLILIAIGVLFLLNNLNPELSVLGLLARFWPFVLIGWGVLRLLEILFWTARGKPLPVAGVSAGEWVLIVFLSLIGSGVFFVHQRANWPHIRIKGVEVFGNTYDYTIPEKSIQSPGNTPRVVIENVRGNARIVGTGTTDVRVSGRKTVRAYDRTQADNVSNRMRFETRVENDTVYITAGSDARSDEEYVTADLEISVPKGARLECRGRRGDFDVTDLQGDVDIQSDNAGVRVQTLGGNLRVETRTGDIIRATGVKGTVEVRGSNHDVELENIEGQVLVAGNYFGDLEFRNISKPVRFEGGSQSRTTGWRVESCPGSVRMADGKIIVDRVVGPVTINAKSKDVVLNGFTVSADVRLDRGDVEVVPGSLPVPKIDVATGSGNIELALPENAKFTLKATAHKGEVENEYGDVLTVNEQGRTGTVTGRVGDGPSITLNADRGAIRLRRGTRSEMAGPLIPTPPRAPQPPLIVERN